MARPLIVATVAWSVAILAAVAGVLVPGDQERLSLGLFAFAVGLGLLVATVLVVDGLRQRSLRRRAAASHSPLGRLEYLPPVTTGTRLIRWRGGRYLMGGRRARAELTGSAYPRPASSTRQPRIDEVEASPRAS